MHSPIIREPGWIAWVAPPFQPYPPALQTIRHRSVTRMLIVRPADASEILWSTEQALSSGTCAAVLFWPEALDDQASRRLQLGCRKRSQLGDCFSSTWQHAGQPSAAALRLELQCRPGRGPNVHILKSRGGRPVSPEQVCFNYVAGRGRSPVDGTGQRYSLRVVDSRHCRFSSRAHRRHKALVAAPTATAATLVLRVASAIAIRGCQLWDAVGGTLWPVASLTEATVSQSVEDTVPQPTIAPMAVVEEQRGIHRILQVDAAAAAAGVMAGQSANAALALVACIGTSRSAACRSGATGARDAGWQRGWSVSRLSSVLPISDVLLLEIAGSLRLFGGLRELRTENFQRA